MKKNGGLDRIMARGPIGTSSLKAGRHPQGFVPEGSRPASLEAPALFVSPVALSTASRHTILLRFEKRRCRERV